MKDVQVPPRLGIVRPGEYQKDAGNGNGTVRVLKEKCPTCPFRAGSSFNYQLKDIVKRLKMYPEEGMLCHCSYPSDVQGAICRGKFDAYPTEAEITLLETGKIDFIEVPVSQYIVTPA